MFTDFDDVVKLSEEESSNLELTAMDKKRCYMFTVALGLWGWFTLFVIAFSSTK